MPVTRRPNKKDRILDAYSLGIRDIRRIADEVGCRPSYVAQVLQGSRLIERYFDLYTHTSQEQNVYSRAFRGALSFRNPEAARASVRRIDELYEHFDRLRDRAGQHQAMLIALTGLNRARWSGKLEEALIFRNWLIRRMEIRRTEIRQPEGSPGSRSPERLPEQARRRSAR